MKKQSTSLIPLLCVWSKHLTSSGKNWRASIALTFFAAFYSNFGFAQPCTVAPITASGTGIITTVAGNGSSTFSGDGGPATAAGMGGGPAFSAVDLAGNVYIGDNYHLRKITPLGIINTIAGTGASGNTGDGGPATAATFGQITGVAIDASGNIYIADGVYHRIRKMNTAGVISHFAGSSTGLMGSTGDGGPATAARFNDPRGIAVDAAGRLYIADLYNNRIRMVDGAGTITAVAGTGVIGTSGDGGPATTATLYNPSTVAVDAGGNIFMAFTNDYRIRKVDALSGIISTIAGTGTIGSSGDGGPATAAQIMNGYGIATDVFGNVYFSDYGSRRVRKIDGAGIITTIAGTGSAGYSGDGGPATAATIDGPMGINYYGGDLYLAEYVNHRVRKINVASPFSLCEGSTLQLSDPTPGGTWSSSSIVAAVDPTGMVSGIVSGTSTITYQMSATCFATAVVTVNPYPGMILGTLEVCTGGNTTLSSVSPGGTWSSSNPSVAIINSSTGVMTGIVAGTSLISYTLPTGCASTTVVTVDPLPFIAGSSTLCVGASTTLGAAPFGGMFSSDNPIIATVDAFAGVVTGVSPGVANISYTSPTGCFASMAVTVTVGPTAITGSLAVCEGMMTSLSSTPAGGTWSSSTSSIAFVDAVTGVVSGISAGTATITYQTAAACFVTAIVTVNALPGVILGTLEVCTGSTTSLANISAGGSWSSSNPSIAAISLSTGVVTGLSPGTSIISYTLSTGCFSTTVVTVDPLPIITGSSAVCIGASITLGASPAGGMFTSNNPSIASVDAFTGMVTGNSAGIANITYTLPSGCMASMAVTVNVGPTPITGPGSVCLGSTITLSSSPTGGTWSSSFPTIGSVGATTGIVGGLSLGTTTITYSTGTGCVSTLIVTVNANPGAITGSATLCAGSTTTLTSTPSGGTWASSNTAVGTIDAVTGVLAGIAAGTTRITYANAAGCFVTRGATVNAIPTINPTSATTICLGGTAALSGSPFGGTWVSSTTSVATVSPGGLVSSVGAGTTTITYTMTATGCRSTKIVTVNAMPSAITPATPRVCVGSTLTMGNSVSGGAWTSGNLAVGTISAAGEATGITAGTTRITYAIGTCSVTSTLTVNSTPTINPTSATSLCVGDVFTVTGSLPGGTWSSSNIPVASVSSGGIITAISSGTATISYTMATGCFGIKVVTVNTAPAAITPSSPTVCEGRTTTLSNSVAGGTWTSSDASVATVGLGTGVVSGNNFGTCIITYAIGSCSATTVLTVNASPLPITGSLVLCSGSATTLSSATAGGTWSTSNASVGVVDITGVVTGISSGTTNISYTLGTGCYTTTTATVNAGPAAIMPSSPVVCEGSTITLTNTVPGGIWTSSNVAVADIGFATGVVTGFAAGTTTVTYTIGTCIAVATVTVNPTPIITTPLPVMCVGVTSTLAAIPVGGMWSSSNLAVSSVDAAGVVTAVGAGTANISYTLGSGCSTFVTATVDASPTAIMPSSPAVCVGSTTTLSNSVSGGTWTSSDPVIAAIGSTDGVVTGLNTGTAFVTYTIGTCSAVTIISVNAAPGLITPTSPTLCIGSTTMLVNVVVGGTWSSSNSAVASVDMFSGVVTGVTMGTADITYAIPTGCYAIVTATVNSTPAVITPTSPAVCEGNNIFLSNSVAGGTWASDNVTVATVDAAGNVTGIAAGTAVITYAIGGCIATTIVTVNAGPAAILPSAPTVCAGASITLTDAITGGIWTSSDATVAMVGSITGILTGAATGTATVSYTVGGCTATVVATVNSATTAGIISGPSILCLGSPATYTDAVSGGVWSTNTGTATISSSGVAIGVSAGADVISYTISNFCGTVTATMNISVNATPSAGTILGPSSVCAGSSISMSSTVAGGVWSSSDNAIATAGASGLIAGVSAGTVIISYSFTDASGCTGIATAVVTVNALPTVSAITGTPAVCVGGTTTLGNATPGGAWTSSATGIATVSSSGVVAGVASGSSVISYSVTDGFGCTGMATVISTVNLTPAASPITGTMAVCTGSNTALFNAVPGGVWSSSNLSVGTVGIAGIVTGMSAGTATISYVVSNSCGSVTNTAIVTVNLLPAVAPITSSLTTLCTGAAGSVSNSTPGGVWSSSNPSVATVSSTGLVTGVSAGTVNIIYTVTNAAGCSSFAIYTLAVAPGFGSLAVMPTPGATMCDSASVYMYVTPPASGLTYQWRIGGVDIPGAISDGYTATSPGGYSVMVGNGMCSMVLAGPAVALAPSPTIGFNPPSQLFTGSFAGYQWYLNGVAIPGATTSVLNFTADGTYTVKVFDVNGCGVMSQPYDVKTTGTPALVGIGDIKVYPNPATSVLFIDAAVKVNASVLAMDGKTITTQKDATRLNISKLPAGIYMIMIYDDSNLLLKALKFSKVD